MMRVSDRLGKSIGAVKVRRATERSPISVDGPMHVRSMSDQNTTLAELRQMVAEFVAARDWQQFHSPKNLAMSLAIEAAELMEHFQWLTTEQSREIGQRPEALTAVSEEIADVLCYAFALANELQIDLASAIRAKMVKNEEKYPAEKVRGRYGLD